jgi:transposase-like protein
MFEMVIKGVSTRKIENITEELCDKSFSKSTVSKLCKHLDPIVAAFKNRRLDKHYPFVIPDAMYIKVREDGRVRSKGLLIATVVNAEDYREVIGSQQICDAKSRDSWTLLYELKRSGLN